MLLLQKSRVLPSILAKPIQRKLTTTAEKKAGGLLSHTAFTQGYADMYHAHTEIKYMFRIWPCLILFNAATWWHSGGDPRFYFGANQGGNYWLKYMSPDLWEKPHGFGGGSRLTSSHTLGNHWTQMFPKWGHKFYTDPKDGHGAYPSVWIWEAYTNPFKKQWRRELYQLIVDIETHVPSGCPRHPLPLGGCAHEANKDSALTKFLKHEGEKLMWCERCIAHH